MTRSWTMAVAVTAVIVLLAPMIALGVPAPGPAPKGTEKWEYCEVEYRGLAKGAGAAVVVRWLTADQEVTAASWEELATKIEAPAARKDAPAASHKLRVLNHRGEQGWELVSYHRADTGPTSAWIFKRKVK